MGSEFITKELIIKGQTVKAKIWDTAGQERFRTITKSYYQQAQGIILVFDVTSRDTYTKLGSWVQNINDSADANVAKILVGNKIDLVDDRVVSHNEGLAISKQFGMDYFETSAKLNENVEKIIDLTIKKSFINASQADMKGSFQLSASGPGKKKKCC